MRSLAFAVVLAASALSSQAHAEPTRATALAQRPEAAIDAQRARLTAALKPKVRARLEPAIAEVLRRAAPAPTTMVRRVLSTNLLAVAKAAVASSTSSALGNLADADIEALAFIVLMEAAKSAQEDLKAIMGRVKAIEAAKNCRGSWPCIQRIAQTPDVSIDALRAELKGKLDSLSEMGETESLRLQMAMDRRSKLLEVLSSLLKKISDTQNAIVQNIK